MATPHSLYVRPRALVVDDSTTLQRQMDLTLRPLGVDIEFSSRGDDAITQALNNTYHVIFLDVMLPGVDGYQVCKTIKRDPRAKRVPVIMLTSKDSTFDKVKGIMAGTSVYLTKPVKQADVLAALESHTPGLLAAGAWWMKTQATWWMKIQALKQNHPNGSMTYRADPLTDPLTDPNAPFPSRDGAP